MLVGVDELEIEILQSCLQYAGFVDANCLMYIWPLEFHNARICLISGSSNPIFTTFCLSSVSIHYLLLYKRNFLPALVVAIARKETRDL